MVAFNLQVAQSVLIVSLEENFHLEDVKGMQEVVLNKVYETGKHKVAINCARLSILDHHTFEALLSVTRALEIMSAKVVICGISGSIAAYLADLTTPERYCFKLDLQTALDYLETSSANT